jgi:NADPH:quinone reductase
VFGEPGFPLSDIPLRKIVRAVAEGKFDAKPNKVWRFGEEGIQNANRYMEEGPPSFRKPAPLYVTVAFTT